MSPIVLYIPIRLPSTITRHPHQSVKSPQKSRMANEKTGIVMHLLLQPDVHHHQIIHVTSTFDEDRATGGVEEVEMVDPCGLFGGGEGVEGDAGDGTSAFDGGVAGWGWCVASKRVRRVGRV